MDSKGHIESWKADGGIRATDSKKHTISPNSTVLIFGQEVTMLNANLISFETQQKELHRQAAEYRLVKSLKEPNLWHQRVFTAIGKRMITSGQQLVNRYQTTQSAHC